MHYFATAFGQPFAVFAIGFVFIVEATEQASALPGNLVGVKGQILFFGHFYGNRGEIDQKGATTQSPAADT